MDTIVESTTYVDVTTVPLSRDEMQLLMNFLRWMRESKYGSFTAEKALHKGFVDVIVSDRVRFEYS